MKATSKNILALVLIFICGVVIGGAGTIILERAMIKRALNNPSRARAMIVRRIVRDYRLTREQKVSIEAIVKDSAKQLAEIRLSVAPDVEKVLLNSRDRIAAELDNTQREKFLGKFDGWMARFKRVYYAGTGEESP